MSPSHELAAITDDLRSLPAALVDCEAIGLGPTGVAGICLVDPGTIRVEHATEEIERVFSPDLADLDPATRVTADRLDQPWVVFETTPDRADDLAVSLAFAVGSLYERGYGDYAFVAAVELAAPHDGRLYLCYRFDERGFYPFAPRPGRRRHRALERRVADAVADGLPFVADRDEWTPLWGEDGGDHPWTTTPDPDGD